MLKKVQSTLKSLGMNKAIWRNDKPLVFFEREECSCRSPGRAIALEESLPVVPGASMVGLLTQEAGMLQ